MNYILDHWTDILAAVMAAKIVAAVIVKLTPTPKDDAILAKVLPWLERLANFVSVRAKK